MPFITYRRAPPLRGDKFSPASPFFQAAAILDGAIRKPKRARAGPTNAGTVLGTQKGDPPDHDNAITKL